MQRDVARASGFKLAGGGQVNTVVIDGCVGPACVTGAADVNMATSRIQCGPAERDTVFIGCVANGITTTISRISTAQRDVAAIAGDGS